MWLLLISLLSASATESELSLQMGIGGAPASSWEHIGGPSAAVPVRGGFRVGIKVAEPLLIMGEWGMGGSTFSMSDGDSAVALATRHHQAGLGLKLAPFPNVPVIDPYVLGEATVGAALLRLDDDLSTSFNGNQLRYRRASPGGYAALGIMVGPPHDFVDVGVGGFAELGYSLQMPYDFAELGEVKASGVVFKLGFGMRFGKAE